MTRRPKSRLPAKLPDPRAVSAERARAAGPADVRPPSTREQLKRAHVAGRSAEFGRDEIVAVMRRVSRNETRSLLGCSPFEGITLAQVRDAVNGVYGWDGTGARPTIAARHTIDSFEAACARILEVARGGGRIAFATAAPASLFPVHRVLAAEAVAVGGNVFDAVESAAVGDRGPRSTRLRWLDRVAMVSDGGALLDGTGARQAAADELLFTIGGVDLVVADRVFAGHALACGLEVVAFAGLDAVALAVAAWRGMALRVVPVDEHRPPSAYQPLLDLLLSA
jgi:hypothetical protein